MLIGTSSKSIDRPPSLWYKQNIIVLLISVDENALYLEITKASKLDVHDIKIKEVTLSVV